jgi:D-alanine transaminase/branched-chain amino acid aminotransferase
MTGEFVLINDNLIPADSALVSIKDLAIQRGYAIFDFFKLVEGRPIFLDDHLELFYNSAAIMRLPVKQNREKLKELLYALLAKNDLPNSGVRLTLTGGYSQDGFNLATPNLFITQQDFKVSKEMALTGTSLVSYAHQRQFPEVKTIDYLMAIWLKDYIIENDADDVLYQQNGIISECPRSNIFIISQEGTLLTPSRNILKGVIRKQVLALGKTLLNVKEQDMSLMDVYKANEVFITSTTKNIMPVMRVDGHLISDGKPGEITQTLQKELLALIDQQKHVPQ